MFKSFSLQTFLLLIAVVAIAIACFTLGRQIAELKSKLQPLRVVSNSLSVDDPEQFAIVRDPGVTATSAVFTLSGKSTFHRLTATNNLFFVWPRIRIQSQNCRQSMDRT